MAYVISPYSTPAILPRDNTGAQLVSEIAKSGYARRMKEMEQKMKLQEEGKKKFDEAYKYANLDLKNIDPIYHNPLKVKADALARNMIKAFEENPATFKNNTDIADQIRKLNEEKGAYEQLSSRIKSENDAKRQIMNAGKMDIISSKYGTLYDEYNNPETPPERKREIESLWSPNVEGGFTGANLYIAQNKIIPYTWNDFGEEIENLQKKQDNREITFPQKETVIATIMNDPNKKASMAAQAGIDISTPEGEKDFVKRLESYMPKSKTPAGQGRGYSLSDMKQFGKPEPAKIDFKMTTETNKGMELYPSSVISPAVISFSTAFPTALVQPSASYNIETGKPVNKEDDFKNNDMYEVALSTVAMLPVYKKGTTRKGGVDVSYEIVDDANLKDPRLKDKIEYGIYAIGQGTKDITLGSRGKETITRDVYIPINQVKDAVWDKLASTEKASVMENINDMKNQAFELNKKLKTAPTTTSGKTTQTGTESKGNVKVVDGKEMPKNAKPMYSAKTGKLKGYELPDGTKYEF